MHEGQTIKNYKELCKLLEEPTKVGKSKILQLKEFERYFKYNKKGNKYMIISIYEIPLMKIDNRKGGNNSTYAENVDKLIIHICSLTQDSIYHYSEFSLNGFLLQLKMINQNYNIGRNNINKFSRYLEIPIETLYDFFNSTSKKNKDILESGLNRLKNKCLIDWYKETKVCTSHRIYRKATDSELETIKEIEQEVLLKLKMESKKDVFLNGKWSIFSKEVNKMCMEYMDILYYFEAYKVINTKKFRNILLDEQQKIETEWELNYDISQSCIKTAENKHDKMIQEYESPTLKGKKKIPLFDSDKNKLSDTYIDDTKKVVKICIDYLNTNNLMEALENIANNKYTYDESINPNYEIEELLNSTEYKKLF